MTNFNETTQNRIDEVLDVLARIKRWENRIREEQETTITEMLYYSAKIIEAEKEENKEKAIRMKNDMLDSASFGTKRIIRYKERMQNAINTLGDMENVEELDEFTKAQVSFYAQKVEFTRYQG